MKVAITQLAILLGLTGVAASLTHWVHPGAPVWYQVEEAAADDEIEFSQLEDPESVLWLDARPKDQFDAGHIPGAHPLNEASFDDQLFDLLDTLQTHPGPIVIYCGAKECQASRKIRQRLLETFALENVWVLRGGWDEWVKRKPSTGS